MNELIELGKRNTHPVELSKTRENSTWEKLRTSRTKTWRWRLCNLKTKWNWKSFSSRFKKKKGKKKKFTESKPEVRMRLEAPSQVVTDSRLLEWLSAEWVTELALGSQMRTFLSLEVVANTLPSAFHDRLWKTSSSLFKALKVHTNARGENEAKGLELKALKKKSHKLQKNFFLFYSWALVACECPTRSWHFPKKWKAKNRPRDETRRFLFDADEYESIDTRESSKSLTIRTLECSTIWSFVFFAIRKKGKWGIQLSKTKSVKWYMFRYHGILGPCSQ